MSIFITWIVVAILLFIAWLTIGIVLWVKGSKQRRKGMMMFGGFMTLGFIGLIITAVTSSGWTTEKSSESLEVEKEKLALEREKFEFEKEQAAKKK